MFYDFFGHAVDFYKNVIIMKIKGVIIMSEPMQYTFTYLSEKHDGIFKLIALGYQDYRKSKGSNFYRSMRWTSLHFVRNGKGRLFIGDRKYRVNAGDFFLVPANVNINYYPDNMDPWRYFWICFSEDSLFDVNFSLGLSKDAPVRRAASPQTITALFDSLFEPCNSRTDLYYKTLITLMEIMRSEHSESVSPIPAVAGDETAERIKTIIDLNYTRPDFSIHHIAPMLYMSQRHLGRLFKKEMNITPIAYLMKLRLEHAAELLHERDYSVRELAESSGFDNEAYFMRCFKKNFGMTIKEYRRTHADENK